MDEAQGRPWGSGTSAGRLTAGSGAGWFGCRHRHSGENRRVAKVALPRTSPIAFLVLSSRPLVVTFLNSTLYVATFPLKPHICTYVVVSAIESDMTFLCTTDCEQTSHNIHVVVSSSSILLQQKV